MEKTKIKICFVASADITLKFLLFSNIKFFAEKGFDVSAVCSDGKWVGSIREQGIKVQTIKIKRKITPFYDLLTLYRLWNYFRKEGFDIVSTFTPKPGLLGQLAARMAGVPIVFNTIFGFYFHEGTPYLKRKFFVFVEKIAAKCSSFIFFRNKEDFETAKKEKIIKGGKAEFIGDGVDVLKFDSVKFSQEFVREKKEKLGIDIKAPIIGITARLVKEKGYLELFRAFKDVLSKFPDSLLLSVGSADLQKKDSINPDIVKKFGIEKNIVFLGERTDMDEIYSLMDIFVLPSHREGFSHSIMEASAMSRPVIASDIRGCRGAVEAGVTGLLVPAKNHQKLAEAIICLLSDPDKAKKMGEAGRKKAEEEFNETFVFGRMREEYKRLLKEKSFSQKYEPPDGLKDIFSPQRKICHVTTVDITARFIVLDFLRFLKKKKYKTFIVCSSGKWAPFLRKEGFSVHNIKMTRRITTPMSDLVSLIKMFLYFRKEKFDIVHTYTPKAGILGRIAARLAGVPVVIHSSYGFYIGVKISPRIRKPIMFAEKIASYFCDLVFSQNKEDIELAIREKIVSKKKIKLLTYGIDIERFDPIKFNETFVFNRKKELGIEDKKIIGMVGRFVKEKGYLDLFGAFKIVRKKVPNASLLLVAPADKEKEDALDKSILEKYGIEKETVLLGYDEEIADVEEVYSLMDVFVLPSYREGFSMSLLEAQAMKKPVVATDIRGCRESIDNGKTGILVPTASPEKLAEAIIIFLSDHKKSVETGEKGRERVLEEFDERVIFDRIEKEYDALLERKLNI